MGRPRQTSAPASVQDDGHAPAPARRPQGANWLAAYAMGLASAKRRIETCLHELVKAADGDPARLVEAKQRIAELDGFDHKLRRQAHRLLSASLEHLDTGPSGHAGSGAGRSGTPLPLGPRAAPAVTEGAE